MMMIINNTNTNNNNNKNNNFKQIKTATTESFPLENSKSPL